MRRTLMTGKFALALVGAVLLAFAITGCDNPANGGNADNISIFRGGTPAGTLVLWLYPYGGEDALRSVQLGARIVPGSTYYQNASWSSSNTAAATVSSGGYVTAVAAGTTTITATTAAGRTASVTIHVRGYEPPTEAGPPSEHAGNLLILQAAAVGSADGNAHRTFVELHNRSNATISLDGLSLQYAVGQGNTWNVIPLRGSIPAGHSFLILGVVAGQGSRLQLPDGDADKLLHEFQLSNRAFRLALMDSIVPLTVHNPSDMSHNGTVDLRTLMPAANAGPSDATVGTERAAGLIDMLGVINDRTDNRDIMHGAKGAPAYRISNQTSIRRTNLDASTNNFNDFRGLRWATPTAADPIAVADDQIAIFRPRNLAADAWTPTFPEPTLVWVAPPPPPPPPEGVPLADRIIILQANRSGNNNGGGGGFPNSLVELFNLTNAPITLTGNYFLHIGAGTGNATTPATTWNYVIPLTGTIPARSSFLVVSTADTNDLFRADLPAADQTAAFNFHTANHWTVALMTRSESFTGNPFTDEELWPYYVDMLGAGNNALRESASAETSQPQAPRRISLVDTNNNYENFAQADFRGHWGGTTRIPNDELYQIWPRNSSAGVWDPTTGIPARHPRVVVPPANSNLTDGSIPGTVEQEATP